MLFLFETPENKGFKEKIGSKFDTTIYTKEVEI